MGKKGAERLLGKGHLLASERVYVQVPWMDEVQMQQLVDLIRLGDAP